MTGLAGLEIPPHNAASGWWLGRLFRCQNKKLELVKAAVAISVVELCFFEGKETVELREFLPNPS